MTKYPDAVFLSVGDRFQLHHDGRYARVAVLQPNDDDTITVVFDDPANSSYTFKSFGERVVFPRRSDGSTIDWRTMMHVPTPLEVYPGDRLPNPHLPDAPLELTEPQIVTHIVRNPGYTGDIRVYDVTTVMRGERGSRRYRFHEHERLTWPRDEIESKPRGRVTADGEIIWHGPYTHPNSPGASFYFAEHPTGRGRWPRGINAYQHNFTYEEGEHRLRFPRNDWDPALVPSSADLPVGRVKLYRAPTQGGVRWL